MWLHKLEVGLTFFEQLVLPYMMLVPHRWFRCFAAVMEIFFQFCIVGTGNYAWINYVGILPCIALFDDKFIDMVESNVILPIFKLIPLILDKSLMVGKTLVPNLWGNAVLEDDSEVENLSENDRKEINDVITETLKDQLSSKQMTKDDKSTNSSSTTNIINVIKKTLTWSIESTYHFSIICLLAFMTYKAKDPIKELFGPAPWINAYDDYFFMTSQGI